MAVLYRYEGCNLRPRRTKSRSSYVVRLDFGASTRRRPRLSANVAAQRRTMSTKSLEIRAMAFISSQNHPMLVRTFKRREDEELKFHYVAHTALDVIEERRGYQTSFQTTF